MGMSSNHLDLSVIDAAYGDYADLYSDVLRVSVAASPEQIQMAYFDRRSELFTLLAKLDARPDDETTLQERIEAERKMDSVVLTVRVLGDPDQRSIYDGLRQKRLLNRRRAQQGQLPGHKSRVPAGFDAAGADVEEEERRREKREERRSRSSHASKSQKKNKKHKKRRDEGEEQHTVEEPPPLVPSKPKKSTVPTPDMIESFDEQSLRQTSTKDTDEMKQDDATVYTLTSVGDEKLSYFSFLSHSKVMRRIADEISGACEDTLISVDQVFNAFTLTDKDIRAVTKRIDKAKRQLDS